MTRARSGKTVLRGRKRMRKLTKGFRAGRHHLYRQSVVTLMRGRVYAFRDRRVRKREFRKLWIVRINAACRMRGLRYGQLIAGLQRALVELDRKTLAALAIEDPNTFTKIVELARANLPAGIEITLVARGARSGARIEPPPLLAPRATHHAPRIMSDLAALEQQALAELQSCSDEAALRAWNTRYFGKQGAVPQALGAIGKIAPAERKAYGQKANQVKVALTQAYESALAAEKARALEHSLASEALDVTLPGRPAPRGRLHLSRQTLRDVCAVFADMGFQIYRSPEVEDDETNFGLLNMPEHHPARDMWDTFHTTTPGVLLRTHTSPGQIHVMRQLAPGPIRVILPGMVYRYEQVTPSKEIMFHQVEGLAVGETITMADLKGTLIAFARRMFGAERRVRIRSSYFPFTEPSIEVDMDCIVCGGKGCALCKRSGWLEILGAGMVHPVVLRNGGYDPDRFSGFAFGMGLERIAMLRYGLDDIRQFWANDLRFLSQF